jgi:dihydrofolate reductase
VENFDRADALLFGRVTYEMMEAAARKHVVSSTEKGLIDEYEFALHPKLAGHGPTLFAGLSKSVDLRLVSRQEFGSGAASA